MFTAEQEQSLRILEKLLSEPELLTEIQKEVEVVDSLPQLSPIAASEYFDRFHSQFYFGFIEEGDKEQHPSSKVVIKKASSFETTFRYPMTVAIGSYEDINTFKTKSKRVRRKFKPTYFETKEPFRGIALKASIFNKKLDVGKKSNLFFLKGKANENYIS